MWITTVTYDLAAIRALDEWEFTNLQESINSKKNELKAIDGAGETTPEYPAPGVDNNFDSHSTLTIQRRWNQQANAQAFVDCLSGVDWITVTLEEQV